MLTDNAKRFMAANEISPVISGSAIEQDPNKPARGCRYRLKNGQHFVLSADECRQVGYPRWDLSETTDAD